MEKTFDAPITAMVFNLGAQVGSISFEKGSASVQKFQKLTDMALVGLWASVKSFGGRILKNVEGKTDQSGFIGITGATASVRAVAGQKFHAPVMY